MNSRKLLTSGRNCICQMGLVLLLGIPAAWGQASNPAPAVAAQPVASHEQSTSAAVPPRLNLYLGHAQDLLSNTQWSNLLVSQPVEDAEPVSDSRDWSQSGSTPEVKVEAVKMGPEVPGGIGGLFWAIRHPLQAWRILAPDSK